VNLQTRFAHILNALLAQLPGSSIIDFVGSDWRSATFEGFQISFCIKLDAALPEAKIADFIARISESQLPADEFFVADASAIQNEPARIDLEMLILKE